MFLCFKLETIVSYWEEYCKSVQSWLLSQVWNIKINNLFKYFNRVRVLHLDKLMEGTWLHSFALYSSFCNQKMETWFPNTPHQRLLYAQLKSQCEWFLGYTRYRAVARSFLNWPCYIKLGEIASTFADFSKKSKEPRFHYCRFLTSFNRCQNTVQ